jgi:hypothetical protein
VPAGVGLHTPEHDRCAEIARATAFTSRNTSRLSPPHPTHPFPQVGLGQLEEAEIVEALQTGAFSRSASLALTAPPQGLVLRHVLFGGSDAAAAPAFGLDLGGESMGVRGAGLRRWRASTVRAAAT